MSILFVDFCCVVVSLKLATNCFQSWFQIDGGNRGVQREFDWSRRWAENTIKEISRKYQGNMIKEIPRKYDQGNTKEIWSRKCHQGVLCEFDWSRGEEEIWPKKYQGNMIKEIRSRKCDQRNINEMLRKYIQGNMIKEIAMTIIILIIMVNLVRRELPLSSFESQVKYDNGNIKEIR